MTKKDYILIAEVIKKEAKKWEANSKYAFAIDCIASNLATELQQTNPKFDRIRFLKACMPE